jgi:hypothetical protein
MDINNDIIKAIEENINKNSDFEFIAKLNDVTLFDLAYIEKMVKVRSKLTYTIIDKRYIRIGIYKKLYQN